MKLQVFGSKSLKTESDLKRVSIPTGPKAKEEEIWSLGEQDALHVPILGSGSTHSDDGCSSKPGLLNPFGVYISKDSKKENVKSIEEEVDDIPLLLEDELLENEETIELKTPPESGNLCDDAFENLQQSSIPKPTVEASIDRVIGVYASSELYVKSIAKELSSYGEAEIHCFDSSMSESELRDDTKINMWVVNLSDDDEGLLLDSILELSTDYPTLYLSGSLSKHCKQRIKSFIENES